MHGQLMSGCKLTKVSDPTADGTTQVDSTSVDMAGFEGVIFFTSYATAAADNILHAAQCEDDSTFLDLEGSAVAIGASDEDQYLEIHRPTDRYVRAEAVRATSSVLGDIWALQYGARKQPVDNDTTGTQVGEQHVSPGEGTA